MRTVKPALQRLEFLALEALKLKHPNFPYPPKPKYSDRTSNGLTRCIVDYIRFRGFQAERINSTGRQVKDGNGFKWIKGSSQVGTADISATIQGRSVKIEVKCAATGDKVQSEAQKAYQQQVEQAGGVYLIVRTFQEFYDWFNKRGQYGR